MTKVFTKSENQTLDYMLLPKSWQFQKIETFEGVSDHAGVLFSIRGLL